MYPTEIYSSIRQAIFPLVSRQEVSLNFHLSLKVYSIKCSDPLSGIKNRWKLHLSMEFATESANAVLFYNGRYSEKRDFIAIRISGGQAELVLSLGEELIFVKSYVDGGVNTGSWVKVTVAFDNKVSLDFMR